MHLIWWLILYDATNSFSNVTFVNYRVFPRYFRTGCPVKFGPFNLVLFCNWGECTYSVLRRLKKYLARQKSQILSQAVKNFVSWWIFWGIPLQFLTFWEFFRLRSSLKCILPALSVNFWPKLVVFDQVSTFLVENRIFVLIFML